MEILIVTSVLCVDCMCHVTQLLLLTSITAATAISGLGHWMAPKSKKICKWQTAIATATQAKCQGWD